MFYLVSFHFLDIRFLLTRPFGDDPRNFWLRPQWLWAGSDRKQVGRIGIGVPIPGRDRILPAFNHHATVPGSLVLQTGTECAARSASDDAEQDGFAIRNREFIADEWGQVRFDILVEDLDNARSCNRERIEALLELPLSAPLEGGVCIPLGEAAELVARIYERESLKTSEAFADPDRRKNAVEAAAGTVTPAAETPQVIVINIGGEGGGILDRVTDIAVPCRASLTLLTFEGTPPESLYWLLHVNPGLVPASTAVNSAWSAAFGLSWLIGHLHELSVLKSRVADYEKRCGLILPDLVRTSIKRRNNRFGAARFGDWRPKEVLAGAMRVLWLERGEAEVRLKGIQALVADPRDAGGVTGNIVSIFNIGGSNTLNNNTTTIGGSVIGSNLNLNSTLANVTQSIGQLPHVDQNIKEELTRLVEQLQAELKRTVESTPDRAEQVDAVAASTEELLAKAKAEKPNKTLLQQAIEGTKAIAGTLEDLAPKVLGIVTAIGAIIAKVHGF